MGNYNSLNHNAPSEINIRDLVREYLCIEIGGTPSWKLGQVALEISTQSTVATLSVVAISSYVDAILASKLPSVYFRKEKRDSAGISNRELQNAYDLFLAQFRAIQVQAGNWSDIETQIVGTPESLVSINSAMTRDIRIMSVSERDSHEFKTAQANMNVHLDIQKQALTDLINTSSNFAKELCLLTKVMVSSANEGVLAEIKAEYDKEIEAIKQCVSDINKSISTLQTEINWLWVGFGGSVASTVTGVIGMAIPVIGGLFLGAGIYGTVATLNKIEEKNVSIREKQNEIKKNIDWQDEDSIAATSVSLFSQQLQQFEGLNSRAQKELNQILDLFDELSSEMDQITKFTDDMDCNAALKEWELIYKQCQYLCDINNYKWPNITELSNPTLFSPVGDCIYVVDIAGNLYHYDGYSKWVDMKESALSCIATEKIVVAIDGKPSKINSLPTESSLEQYVKTYDSETKQWTTISDFSVSTIVTDGDKIYCVKTEDQLVYEYNGNKGWNKLPAIVESDKPLLAAPILAIVNGQLFAINPFDQTLMMLTGKRWNQVWDEKCSSIIANQAFLGITTLEGQLYHYNPESDKYPIQTQTGDNCVLGLAQLSNGSQCFINSKFVVEFANVDEDELSDVKEGILEVYASDTNICYSINARGQVFRSTYPSYQSWEELPALGKDNAS